MMNDLAPKLDRRKRAAWGANKSIEDAVKKTKNNTLRTHLFNTTVLPALTVTKVGEGIDRIGVVQHQSQSTLLLKDAGESFMSLTVIAIETRPRFIRASWNVSADEGIKLRFAHWLLLNFDYTA
ncbi:hypothetical protein ANCCEY_12271 [Ancylostoma ceylanicum]|uniref:Uncharacterized protein n=1 Tax=Ancylostoma ceylanicum TaxID=53326 RepID=A0A0D6LLY1_9BILA|nr:hypothetical protein ANCCEY_12271 [Ancylostoma ceylanicum]